MRPTVEQLEHVVELGRAMRRLQKRWFDGDKSTATLHDAKKAERAFDKACDELGKTPEPSLFD